MFLFFIFSIFVFPCFIIFCPKWHQPDVILSPKVFFWGGGSEISQKYIYMYIRKPSQNNKRIFVRWGRNFLLRICHINNSWFLNFKSLFKMFLKCLQRGGVFLCRFRSITQSYYRSAHALILVYDVSNQPTFDCCPDWLREIEEYASSKVRCDSNFVSTELYDAVLSPIEVGSRSIAFNNKRLYYQSKLSPM
jgi:hypothetical protein